MDTNVIYCGDNVAVLDKYIPNESVDLIYIDPPFNSNRNYEILWGEASERRAFNDRYGDAKVYIDWMWPRIEQLYRALKPTGSFYYHCDWHASHYIKVKLDTLFDFDNFRNEIVWKRQSAHSDAKNRFADVTDSILFYAKSKATPFHPKYTAHDPNYVKKFYRFDDGDGRGPYQLDNMTSPNPRPNMTYEWKGFPPPQRVGVISVRLCRSWMTKAGFITRPSPVASRWTHRRGPG